MARLASGDPGARVHQSEVRPPGPHRPPVSPRPTPSTPRVTPASAATRSN